MGSWDTGSFDNDTAADWAFELEGTEDLSLIESTLDAVIAISPTESVPAEIGECAVAAADTLARLQGWSAETTPYTEPVDEWVRAHPIEPPAALIAKARTALTRVATVPSELLELWEEGEQSGPWLDAVRELTSRLRG